MAPQASWQNDGEEANGGDLNDTKTNKDLPPAICRCRVGRSPGRSRPELPRCPPGWLRRKTHASHRMINTSLTFSQVKLEPTTSSSIAVPFVYLFLLRFWSLPTPIKLKSSRSLRCIPFSSRTRDWERGTSSQVS